MDPELLELLREYETVLAPALSSTRPENRPAKVQALFVRLASAQTEPTVDAQTITRVHSELVADNPLTHLGTTGQL